MSDRSTFFSRLTRLFRSGPVVRRKVRGPDTLVVGKDFSGSSASMLFQRSNSPSFSSVTTSAYNMSERLMRYNDAQEMEYCLAPNTLIATPNGFKTIKELADECSADPDKKFIVYSYDHNKKQIIPAYGKQARMTRRCEAFRVKFDSGKEIVGSANHRLMLRDGTFCKIEDLRIGDAMMPFYRKDLYENTESGGKGYQWIYTMNSKHRGWTKEHKLIAEWIADREMNDDEVVHHINFKKDDNRPENLRIMTGSEHSTLHSTMKWIDNDEWVEKFKKNHSEWMKNNNPAERTDITFGRILEVCERVGFNSRKLCEVFDTDPNVIKRKLRRHGFDDFMTFARAYSPNWRSEAWDNNGQKNPRYDFSLTFEKICSVYEKGLTRNELSKKLNTTYTKIANRLKQHGFKSYQEFTTNYENHKVISIESVGVMDLYDLTVDGYKNFATDSVVSHNTAEIAAALDIYSDEAVATDEHGQSLHVYSDDPQIRRLLEELFYNVLNVDFNLRMWTRNVCKYGDFFLYNDVHPDYGIVSTFPVPVNEIEREENYDRTDPQAVRFRWITHGNRVLDNWEITHFRLLGNDAFLPYGSSILEPARRIWRQLILVEDAMLVYRVVRAPERRVFYIDVGGMPADNIPDYMEQQKRSLKSSQVVSKTDGRVDLRYNPLSIEEDYYIPVRGGDTGTKIETLAGGQNAAAVEDVEYLQKKLFAALKIPRAYLGYDEMLSSKSTLAQEDIRFSRTVNVIQKTIIAELNKIAIIHLYAAGFSSDDLTNFTLKLSNPSTIAQLQKIELWKAKFEVAGAAPENMVSRTFIRKRIWGLNDDECEQLDEQRKEDKRIDSEVEGGGGGGAGVLGGLGGGGAPPEAPGGEEPPPPEEPAPGGEEGGETAGTEPVGKLITSGLDEDEDLLDEELFTADEAVFKDRPVKPKANSKRVRRPLTPQERERYNASRREGTGHKAYGVTHRKDASLVDDRRGPLWDGGDGASIPSMKDTLKEIFNATDLPEVKRSSVPFHLNVSLERMGEKLGMHKRTTLTESAQDFEDEELVIEHSSRVNPEDENQ